MFKVNKGITLIALIITIITLLILAGVTISMIVGENGLISKAKESKENAIKSQYTEALKLTLSNMRIENSENIISECQKNPILADSTYTEYPDETAEYKVLILETKEHYQFLVTKTKVCETKVINIENGSVEIYPDYYLQSEQKNNYKGKNFIITGSTTTNNIKIFGSEANTYNISILDLSIDVRSLDNTGAFDIKEGANVNLELIGTNSFYSGKNYAGLQKSSKNGTLTIDGNGALTAKGEYCCAGIGGGNSSAAVGSCTNIIINNGNITASSGNLGPAIGAAYWGSAIVDNIQINGGNVNLGKSSAAGIGNGRSGKSCSNIKITGGKVVCGSWGEGPGIGGFSLNNVEISGGTVEIYTGISSTCPAIGVKNSTSEVENINITGGNVFLHSDKGSITIGTTLAEVPPTDKEGTEVLETVLTLDGVSSELPIKNIEFIDFDGKYGLNDTYTRTNGKVYLYLPQGAKVVSITAGGQKYISATPIEAGTTGTLTH